jgi:hypothetical protein
VRIAAINAQEPMSGVTVVAEDKGSESIARQVVESSRQLYTKKVEGVKEVQEVEPKQNPVKNPSTARKSKKSHVAKKANDKLSEMRPVT